MQDPLASSDGESAGSLIPLSLEAFLNKTVPFLHVQIKNMTFILSCHLAGWDLNILSIITIIINFVKLHTEINYVVRHMNLLLLYSREDNTKINNTKLPMCLVACSDRILLGFARLYTVVADLIICFPRSRRL